MDWPALLVVCSVEILNETSLGGTNASFCATSEVTGRAYPVESKPVSLFFQLPVPVSFCCVGFDADGYEYATQAVSIFQNGFVISSPLKLRTGSLLALRLRIPPDTSGLFREERCTACVTGEQPGKDEELAYKVEIETASLPR